MAKKPKRFRVTLTASAAVHGYVEVEAFDLKQAKRKALQRTGDVSWQYDGTDDATIEAVALDEIK